MSKRYRNNHHQTLAAKIPAWSILAPALAVFFLFLAVRLNTPAAGKWTAILCMLVALGAGAQNFSTLRERFRLPTIALTLFVLMNGISTLYADAGKFALREFLKLLVGFCIALIFLSLAKGEGSKPGRTVATVLTRCVAVSGLVSIDYISTRIISTPVLGLLNLFTTEYDGVNILENSRLQSLSGNANIFAGYTGLGVLLALGLVLSSTSKKERIAHVICLFINSLSFVLAVSRGAIGVIAVAFLVYLVLERKERRGGLFILMAATLVFTLVAVGLISATSFAAWDGSIRLVPLLCVVLGSAALCLIDCFVIQKLERKLAAYGKLTMVFLAVALVAVAVFFLFAFTLTEGIELDQGLFLDRFLYLAPGEYTFNVQGSGPLSVTIFSQNRQDTMMGTRSCLYDGALADSTTFTVPEDSIVLSFSFLAPEKAVLESVHYEGANGSGEIPLKYKLLPEFIAGRLQGLRSSTNFVLRTVYFEDGLKLFRQAPIFGLGIGAYESTIMSVQEFYYQTKYVHNHYIQALAETGIVGCALFVALFVVSGVAILLARRKEDMHPLIPALGAALVFMAGHAAVEVTFSAFDFIPIAFGVFALIEVCCGDAIPSPWMTKKVQTGGLVGTALLVVVFFGMLCSTMMARFIVEEQASYSNLARAAKMDKYEWADYALSYVIGAQRESDPELRAKADELAVELSKIESNTIHIYLAEYYFFTDQVDLAFDRVEDHVTFVASDSETWETAFALLENHERDNPAYRERALRIYQMMQEWDEANIGTITISQEAMDFITRIGG